MLHFLISIIMFGFLARWIGKQSYQAGYNRGAHDGVMYERDRARRPLPKPVVHDASSTDPAEFGLGWDYQERIKANV